MRTLGQRVPNMYTRAFHRWWGAGVLLDQSGQPRHFYHGTPWAGFAKFKFDPRRRNTANETRGLGIWFTSDPEVASTFASKERNAGFVYCRGRWNNGEQYKRQRTYIKHGAVYVAYINLQNPKIYNSDILTDAFESMMDERDQFAHYIDSNWGEGTWRRRMVENDPDDANKLFRHYLQDQGYDGILLRDSVFDGIRRKQCGELSKFGRMHGELYKQCPHDIVLVFHPNQIKTA